MPKGVGSPPSDDDGCEITEVDGCIGLDDAGEDGVVCWFRLKSGVVLGLHEGMIVEYDASTLAPLGLVVAKDELAGRKVAVVDSGLDAECEVSDEIGMEGADCTESEGEEQAAPENNYPPELTCSICKLIFLDPQELPCAHTFCKECIERCQRQNQKRCPSCRKPIATRRSLRPDPNITQLIKRLYPDLEGFEAEEEEAMVEGNREVAERHHAHVSQHYAKIHERQQLYRMMQEPSGRVEYEQGSGRAHAGHGARVLMLCIASGLLLSFTAAAMPPAHGPIMIIDVLNS